jgi:hypothetical protein
MLVDDDNAAGATSECALRRQDAHCREDTKNALSRKEPEAVENLIAAEVALFPGVMSRCHGSEVAETAAHAQHSTS